MYVYGTYLDRSSRPWTRPYCKEWKGGVLGLVRNVLGQQGSAALGQQGEVEGGEAISQQGGETLGQQEDVEGGEDLGQQGVGALGGRGACR